MPPSRCHCPQRVRQELEALKSQAPAVTAAPAPAAPAAVVAPAPAAPAAPAEEEEEGGSAFAALNLVGILAAGGLFGYQTIQKKQAAEAEAAYQTKLEAGECRLLWLAGRWCCGFTVRQAGTLPGWRWVSGRLRVAVTAAQFFCR